MSPEFGFKRGTPPQPLKSHGIENACIIPENFFGDSNVKIYYLPATFENEKKIHGDQFKHVGDSNFVQGMPLHTNAEFNSKSNVKDRIEILMMIGVGDRMRTQKGV
ncbi:hypothetical protein NQ318_012307 [Aromia moschata]|uniref:Uncharacterized protein n=1 Tax=Aromia moschata TaxID=1265417 RepID=A0AAV8YKX0_9CUCU|nr:hypothetical protein NQ318_012307 [Aromia moschata]